jgi:hypothetical protein
MRSSMNAVTRSLNSWDRCVNSKFMISFSLFLIRRVGGRRQRREMLLEHAVVGMPTLFLILTSMSSSDGGII